MLTITVETQRALESTAEFNWDFAVHKREKFDWEGSAEEFKRLWDHCETSARHNEVKPQQMADQVILAVADEGWLPDEEQARGQAVWIVYAVLRLIRQTVPIAGMTEPPTVFDIAAHQQVKANIISNGYDKYTVNLSGRPPVDESETKH